MSAADNKRVVQKIYEALARGDRRAFAEAVHPEYVWRLAGHSSWSLAFEGQAAVQRDLMAPLFALFADQYTARAVEIVAEGNIVVAEVRGSVATTRGERYDNEYCFVFRFSDDKIIAITEYCDTDLIERVLGRYEDAVMAYAEVAKLPSGSEAQSQT
jgi:uncharacterized protein